MPVPFETQTFGVTLSLVLWRDDQQEITIFWYIHVELVIVHGWPTVQQLHGYQGSRRRQRRPHGPLMASQDRATQTDPEEFGTVAEVDPCSAAVLVQAAPAASPTAAGDPEVPVPHTEGQQDSGYGSPGQMQAGAYSIEGRPADYTEEMDKAREEDGQSDQVQFDGQ
ncbi:uncharacterized protein LOC124123171 [Haliotis rufescens]|uniref:uncharacterized protein LOC124123171 n=1 Tax=Haliotis rufescens TaxID=6454 RepID=UPI00201E8EF6|nr:uncharacterized protein LOC124123171 [Haliotis rufescens]XP_048258128.1 uncharacterized protein LOC124123171 [Haliotis rufescens]